MLNADTRAATWGSLKFNPKVDDARRMSSREQAKVGGLASSPAGDAAQHACPSCGATPVLSVRSIFEQGTTVTTVSSSGGAVALGGEGDVIPVLTRQSSTVAASSVLAQRLAPPVQPVLRQSVWARLHSYFLLLTGLPTAIAIILLIPLEPTMGWRVALIGSPIWLGLFVGTSFPVGRIQRRLKRTYEWDVRQWEQLVARWEVLRYCSSCDSVADLTRRRAVLADEMPKLLRAA